jgi:hypothetical protein
MGTSISGKLCTINRSGDLYMDADTRPFIGELCVILKRTKAGLIQVALEQDRKQVYSFPRKNVDILPREV